MSIAIRLALVVGLLNVSMAMAQQPAVPLRGRVVDAQTREPVAARIYVQSADGTWYFPKSAAREGTAIPYQRKVEPASVEQHVTLSAHPFEVMVPPGKYTITVERGKEYVPLVQTIEVGAEPAEVSLAIARWINMSRLGWYSGDVHAHRPLADMPNLVLAEDLNVAMPLSHWVTNSDTSPVAGNRVKDAAPPPKWIPVDATHGIYPLNTEYEIFTVKGKPHTLGAVLICGQKSVLEQGVPPVRRIAEQAHADGAFLDLEKHSWAWSPMIVPLMKVDLFELANNHCWRTEFGFSKWTLDAAPKSMNLEMTDNGFSEWGWIDFGFKSYYAYLNCGFRMMPSAGTGAGVHPVPFGFSRVYVHVPGEFTYDKWRDNLLKGHSFVTTGPMLRLQFNEQEAGQTFQAKSDKSSVRITGVVESANLIGRIEIIQNGDIIETLSPAKATATQGAFSTSLDKTVPFDRSGWLIVRCFEEAPHKRIRFAHSAPVFVEMPGKPTIPKKVEVEHFVDRIERELARHQGVLSADAVDEYNEALSIYRELLSRSR